jgi:hypothetical protein
VGDRAAKLGIDPSDARSPLSSPDGRLRRITVAADGSVTADYVDPGVEVFDGKRSKQDGNLASGSTAKVNPDRFLAPSRTQDPKNYDPEKNPYKGPRCCGAGEGCQPNAL